MVQKFPNNHLTWLWNPCKKWDIWPSQLVFSGFLNHQQVSPYILLNQLPNMSKLNENSIWLGARPQIPSLSTNDWHHGAQICERCGLRTLWKKENHPEMDYSSIYIWSHHMSMCIYKILISIYTHLRYKKMCKIYTCNVYIYICKKTHTHIYIYVYNDLFLKVIQGTFNTGLVRKKKTIKSNLSPRGVEIIQILWHDLRRWTSPMMDPWDVRYLSTYIRKYSQI